MEKKVPAADLLHVLASLDRNMASNDHLRVGKNGSATRLLLIWAKLSVTYDWSPRLRFFSNSDLLLLSLILATVATLLKYEEIPQPAGERKTFLADYDIRKRLALLKPIELFYASVVVTKQVLDLSEDEIYSVSFTRENYQVLLQQILRDPVLQKEEMIRALHLSRFKFFSQVLTSLYLFVVDLQYPLGILPLLSPPPRNADDKIQHYIRKSLHRPISDADYTSNSELESLLLCTCS